MSTTTTTIDRDRIVRAAVQWHSAGIATMAASPDGQKRPLGKWKEVSDGTKTAPSLNSTIEAIRRKKSDGLSVICGKCSGGLEMLEFDTDDAELMAEFVMNLEAAGLGEIWESIVDGVEERSPSGGCHFFYKVDGEPKGNLKLAFAEDGEKATIETRGQGGQVIASYSAGRTHPSGGEYVQTRGQGPGSIPTITEEQRDAIHDAARKCCRQPEKSTPREAKPKVKSEHAGDRSGDEFQRETTWEMILEPLGFTKGREYYYDGETNFEWSRPGKSEGARSVVTGPERMVVFTSGTDLQANDAETGAQKSYSRFEAFVFFRFDGNFSDAASYVRRCKFNSLEWKDIASKKASPPTHTEDNREPRLYREACSLIGRGVENSLDELDLFNCGECDPPVERMKVEEIYQKAKSFIEKARAAEDKVDEKKEENNEKRREKREEKKGEDAAGASEFFVRHGLTYESEEFHPGSWKLIRVIADPVFYELIVPEFSKYDKKSEKIRLDLDVFTSPAKVAFAVREATDGLVLFDAYAKAWSLLWSGDYTVGRGDEKRHILGLKAKLLNEASSRTGSVTDFRSNTVFRLFMSIIDKAQQPDDDDQPDENGRPRWRKDGCVWFQFDTVVQQMTKIDRTICRKDVSKILELLDRRGEVRTERHKFGNYKRPKFLLINQKHMEDLHDASEYGVDERREDHLSGESEGARV